jgi:hypothetical protein
VLISNQQIIHEFFKTQIHKEAKLLPRPWVVTNGKYNRIIQKGTKIWTCIGTVLKRIKMNSLPIMKERCKNRNTSKMASWNR